MKYSVTLPILTILTTAQRSAADICLGACEGNGGDKTCTFSAKVDLHAGELGYYHFEECEGINPTLGKNIWLNPYLLLRVHVERVLINLLYRRNAISELLIRQKRRTKNSPGFVVDNFFDSFIHDK